MSETGGGGVTGDKAKKSALEQIITFQIQPFRICKFTKTKFEIVLCFGMLEGAERQLGKKN